MSHNTGHASPITKVTDLLFFDNLALHYVVQNTPLEILARVLNSAEARLAGTLLGLLTVEERTKLHILMANFKEQIDNEKDEQAAKGLMLIATDQYARGLIQKQGVHYFGTPNTDDLQRPIQ